ncbi:zinc finger protein MAGPIE [Mangifera indica]|uniref:zinc finger protein MAGPIE n=1 Tax=Mangifera indica TaxID=29780 RepID=UPI001CFBB397|nr:zinc finger protein MAGPIE [Mangifera indica]
MAEEKNPIPNGFDQSSVGGSNPPVAKKKRNLPGNPDPEAEVIALSPKTLMATNRFLCEICGKGFQRDQNLQLHRRGHNLPWKLKQRTSKEARKRVYVCPEKTCVHHHPSRALGDLTGIKKHFCRKHGEKKWKCEKCSKRYAVQSDWKAHSKTCGTKEYKCDCGTIFSRRDSFITHRAFCDALAEETARVTAASNMNNLANSGLNYQLMGTPLGPTMAQHFSAVFKPILSNDDTMDQTKRGLSLWMGQGSQAHETVGNNLQEIHQLGTVNSGSLFGDPLVSCSNPPPSDYQLNWVFGNKLSPNNNGEALSSTSLPLSDVKGTGTQLVSVPSLYSSQHSHHATSANMSATALLQKAAQIGATSTDSSFLGSFGLKCSNNQVQDGNKYCGLYGSNSNPVGINLGSDVENSGSDITTLNQLQMYPAAKRRHLQSDDSRGGQTRDFLGVGVQAISCHPSSINGWI